MSGRFGTFLVISLLGLFVVGCNSSTNGSLIGDLTKSSECPKGGCASMTPSDQNILLSSNTLADVYHYSAGRTGAGRFEFSGECSPSTYPSNKIVVSVFNANGAEVQVNVSGVSSTDIVPKCIDGRYNLAMRTDDLGTGQAYTVRVILQAFQAGSTVARTNQSSGQFSFRLTRVN